VSEPQEYAQVTEAAKAWGLPVIRLWQQVGPDPVSAITAPPPQVAVSVTVIHVYAGASLNLGPESPGPRIIQATPVRDAAETNQEIEENQQLTREDRGR
jgi:hypothetical protein